MSLLEDVNETDGKLTNNDISNIQKFFTGKTVFVTGATGSVGKLVVEKLLRSCTVERVYILVRAKKGKEPQERIEELFKIPAFGPLKKQMPNFSSKILLCIGDCLEPMLGLSQNDLEILINDVHCVIHCAATVRFDVTLRKATYINVRATWDLLKIAKEMKQLMSFVHVSTAYSHCPRKDIDEVFYESPMTAQKLLLLVESLKDDILQAITPSVINEWPNTYVFTKAIAEDVMKTEANGLPVSIVRPSIIANTYKEPLAGWVDNFNAFAALALGCGAGLVRSVQCDEEKTIDLIPLDYVVNTIITAAWNERKKSSREQLDYDSTNNESPSTIYNCVSSVQNAISYEYLLNCVPKEMKRIPSVFIILYPSFIITNSSYLYLLCDFLFHFIPAYLIDFVLLCLGSNTIAVNGYKKYKKLANIFGYVSKREWNFNNTNVQKMWGKLNAKDKELFEFDLELLDWSEFLRLATMGGRVYLLKDPLDTIPRARRKLFLLKILHYTLVTFLFFFIVHFVKVSV